MTDEVFARAARTYGDTIYRVAYHALGSPHDAEDVMQTVLLRLYECKKDFESEEHMKHWILRVAVNESRRVLRSFWRRTAVPMGDRRSGGPRPGRGAGGGDGSGVQIPFGRLSLLL